MNTEIPIDGQYLGIDAAIRPEILAFLNAPNHYSNSEKSAESKQKNLDEYEQAKIS